MLISFCIEKTPNTTHYQGWLIFTAYFAGARLTRDLKQLSRFFERSIIVRDYEDKMKNKVSDPSPGILIFSSNSVERLNDLSQSL